MGRPADAARHYRGVVELWREGDEELRALRSEAEANVARTAASG